MDENNSNQNQSTSSEDFDVSILSYNVLFSTTLDKNGPQENLIKEVKEDGEVVLHLEHNMSTHHSVDFSLDFPEGKYAKTIPMDMLNIVESAAQGDKPNTFQDEKRFESYHNTDEDIIKMKKYYRLYDETVRFSLLTQRLKQEMEGSTTQGSLENESQRPIICLQEITRKWNEKLTNFFDQYGYKVEFIDNPNNPNHDNMGILTAYPTERYELLAIQKAFPFRNFDIPSDKSINQLKHDLGSLPGKIRTSNGTIFPDYSEEELNEILQCIVTEARPFMFVKFKLATYATHSCLEIPLQTEINGPRQHCTDKHGPISNSKEFALGVYHTAQKVMWKTKNDTLAGPIIMGTYAFALRWYFEIFLRKYAPVARNIGNVVLVGDFNIQPRNVRFQYLTNGKVGDDVDVGRNENKTSNEYEDASTGNQQDEKHVTDCVIKTLFEFNFSEIQSLLADCKSNIVGKGNAESWIDISNEALIFEHVYKDFFGEFPELTTKTQKFIGCIDHFFKAASRKNRNVEFPAKDSNAVELSKAHDMTNTYGMRTISVRRMPTIKQMEGKSFPNIESEPSDHLCQGAVFRLF